MLALVLSSVLFSALPPQVIEETITVSRIVLDVRVTDLGGRMVTDLTAEDFDVRIAGKRMIVESAEWIDETESRAKPAVSADEEDAEDDSAWTAAAAPQDGRLLIFFVQTDFARTPSMVAGHMNFFPYALELIDSLAPTDHVAVFSFDSHLKFRLDFTTDREAAKKAMESTILIDDPPPPAPGPEPSLAARLDPRAMRNARDSEDALFLIGRALLNIPGSKSLLLIGWGLGKMQGINMKWRWSYARPTLQQARVSVFSIDTTYVNFHDLEAGLKAAAEQTGGMYVKSFEFPQNAMELVRRTLSGRYELTLVSPVSLRSGSNTLDVRTTRRGATVLAPSSVIISE